MRDLTRSNAKEPAWIWLRDKGFDVFTPLKWRISVHAGRRERQEVPVIHDLLFVHSDREPLDRAVASRPTLQYRFARGGDYQDPMTVRTSEMERFIMAVNSSDSPIYYSPDELTPSMYGREISIVGGPLDGYSGRLLSVRGMRTRRLLVELPGLLTAAVEVVPDYISISR